MWFQALLAITLQLIQMCIFRRTEIAQTKNGNFSHSLWWVNGNNRICLTACFFLKGGGLRPGHWRRCESTIRLRQITTFRGHSVLVKSGEFGGKSMPRPSDCGIVRRMTVPEVFSKKGTNHGEQCGRAPSSMNHEVLGRSSNACGVVTNHYWTWGLFASWNRDWKLILNDVTTLPGILEYQKNTLSHGIHYFIHFLNFANFFSCFSSGTVRKQIVLCFSVYSFYESVCDVTTT